VTATGHNLSGEIRYTSPAFRFVRQIEPGPAQTLSPLRHRLLELLNYGDFLAANSTGTNRRILQGFLSSASTLDMKRPSKSVGSDKYV